MESRVSERTLLEKFRPTAFADIIPEDILIATFTTKCCLTNTLLKYPVINLKCTPRCYMNMDAFLKSCAKDTYICVKCNQARKAEDVVYDVGLEMIIDPENTKKNNNRDEIHIDRHGMIYKERKAPLNGGVIKKVTESQIGRINEIRENEKLAEKATLVVDVPRIRSEMSSYYRELMTKISCNKGFLFCRGKAAQRGGREYYSTIYVYDKDEPYHLSLRNEGREICMNREGEIHYIPERRAFYIVAKQGVKLRLFQAKIDNILGNKLELKQIEIQDCSRQFFGVAHSQNYIFIVGGQENNRTTNTVLSININNGSIEKLPPMKEDRAAVKACFFNNKLYVLGGASKSTTFNLTRYHQIYDFAKKSWTQVETTFKGFNLGVFVSNNQLIVYGGSQDSSNEKFINEYYIVNPDNLSVISKNRISDKDLKLQFSHQNPGCDGSVIRPASKPQNQLYLFSFSKNGATVNSGLRLDI